MKQTPVGVAQRKVLDALHLTADDFGAANQIFEILGIEVTSRRVGRSSEPVVSMMQTEFGGFNPDGDGETWTKSFKNLDLTPIRQWIEK